MLTILDAISIAGSRGKQNDDACGWSRSRIWAIDGATDLYGDPVMGAASDAAWLAHRTNAFFHAEAERIADPVELIASAAADAGVAYDAVARDPETWRRPAAAVMLAWETPEGVGALDLGDCRLFAADSGKRAFAVGGRDEGADDETRAVVAITGGDASAALDRANVIDALRQAHSKRNTTDGWWVFGPDRRCAAHARRHALALSRPAHLVVATDGFAALVDRYRAHDAQSLVEAALARGLAALALELRSIEEADADAALHPRWKRSDDATALLVRLD